MKILIVEDDESVRGFLKALLSEDRHTVGEAANGQEALARVREHRPDLIISDGLMPVMDGFQLLQALKADPGISTIPFIFLSAVYTGRRELELARSLGADAFLVKPQMPEAILQAIRDATAGREPSSHGRSAPATNDPEFAQEYSRVVATLLEKKVQQLEATTAELERTQKELRESATAYRRLFESNPHPMWVYDCESLAFLAVNDTAVTTYGYSREEFLAMTIKDIRPPEDGPELLEFLAERAGSLRTDTVWRHRKKDGTFFDAVVSSHAIDFSGKQARIVLAIDVSVQIRMEGMLRAASDQWRATFDAMTEAVALLDEDGRIQRCNKAMAALANKPYSEIIGSACADFCVCVGGDREACPFLKSKRTLKRVSEVCEQGGRWFEASSDPILDENGAFQGAVHILKDITERKQADEILKKRESQLAESQRIAGIGSWERDLATNAVVWSKELFRIFGLDPERVAPSYEILMGLILPEDREIQQKFVQEAIRENKPYTADFRIMKPDGTTVLIHSQGEVVYDETNRPFLLRGTAQDITERRRMEDALKAAVVRAEDEKARSDSIIAAIGDGISIQDRDFRILYENEAQKKMVGDHVGEPCYLAYEKKEARCEGCGVAQVFKDGGTHVVERSASTEKGLVHVEITASPLRDSKGNIIAGIEIVHNITERKKAEDLLREQKRLTENMIMGSAIATFVLDAGCKVLIWNKACEVLTGVPAAEMIGTKGQWKPFYDHKRPVLADIVLGQETEKLESLYSNVSTSELLPEGLHAEGWFKRLNGRDRYVVFDAAPIRDSAGAVIAAIETLQDITERKQAEDAVQESEKRYRAVVENAFDMIQTIAPDGRFLYVNPAWARTIGYSPEELHTMKIFDMLSPACQTKCSDVFSELKQGTPVEHFETQYVAKNGRMVDLEGSASARIVDGAVEAIQCILHDVTERKKLEEQIHRSRQDWEYTFNSITDMVTVHDVDYNIILANKSAQKILGLPILEKTKDRKCFSYYHGTEQAPEGCPSCGCLQTGLSASFELFEPHLDMFIEIRAIPRFDSAGTLIGLIHVVRDITERKQAEEAIARYNKQLTALSTASNNLLASTSLTDIYQQICDIIHSVFSVKMVWLGIVDPSDVIVHPVAHAGQEDNYLDAITVTWDGAPTGRGPTGTAIRTGKAVLSHVTDTDYLPWRSEAEKRGFVSTMAVPLLSASGACIGALSFYGEENAFTSDSLRLTQIFANQAAIAIENARLVEGLETKVFERTKELEDTNIEIQTVNKELVLRREEAEAASRSKTDFLANMSHELRTPLNAIMGFSEIMLMDMAGPISEKQREFLNDISMSGKHLLTLINDILDLSKVEAGKMELEPEPVIVEDLIAGSLMMFKEKTLKHAITVETFIDAAVEDITADRRKLKQALMNLLSNAFKFTPDGGSVRVSARRIKGEKVGRGEDEKNSITSPPLHFSTSTDQIEISVSDTGIGIPREQQNKLFQPFEQINSTLSRRHAGTGLGLSLCRRFVELHGGRIWVESDPGKGSTFRFAIPVRQP